MMTKEHFKETITAKAVNQYKTRLVEALNRLDEFASYTTADNDNNEAEQQEKDYELLMDFIEKRV